MTILNQIQRELKAPKSQRNTFGNYDYRSCEDILEAVKPFLGFATLVLCDEIVLVGDRYYVKATATISDGTSSVSASAYARESVDKKGMDVAQITGAASSYARKYALNGLFCIDDTKDSDNTNKGENGEYIDDKQKNTIVDSLTEINSGIPAFCTYMKVESLDKITKADYPKAMAAIEAAKKRRDQKK